VKLLKTTKRSGLRFCPLEYIRVMSKELDKVISECKLVKPEVTIVEDFSVPCQSWNRARIG